MAETLISDQPTVSREGAAMFFNMGRNRFRKRWDEHYRFIIRHVETDYGMKLLLVDVIQAAFPQATSETIHIIAYQHLKESLQRRYRTKAKQRTSKDEGGKGS